MGTRTQEAECYLIRGCGLDRAHNHTFRFKSREEQSRYFKSKASHHFTAMSHIRVWGSRIRVPHNALGLFRFDYLMFRNSQQNESLNPGRWWYAFIDSAEYVNEETTEIIFTIDWIQTFLEEAISFRPAAFCIRQHSPDDILFENTAPEPVSTGGMYNQIPVPGWSNIGIEAKVDNDGNFVNWAPVIVKPKGDASFQREMIDGIPASVDYVWGLNWDWYEAILKEMNEDAKNSIIDIFMYPVYLLNRNKRYEQSVPLPGINFNPWEQDEWQPHNNKLYTYPFCFTTVKAGNQGSIEYRSEFFSGSTEVAKFHIYGTMGSVPQFLCVPVNYGKVTNADAGHVNENFQAALTLTGVPKVPWITDSYKVWLAQKESQVALQNIDMERRLIFNPLSTGINMLQNLASGNVGGLSQSLIRASDTNYSVYAQQAQLEDAKNMSNVVSNYGSSEIYYKCGEYGFRALYTYVKEEYARKADAYFDVFGYAVNRVRRPNFFARRHYSYFQYAGFNLPQGHDIPDSARTEWQNVMQKGITFWDTDVNIGDYSVASTN